MKDAETVRRIGAGENIELFKNGRSIYVASPIEDIIDDEE